MVIGRTPAGDEVGDVAGLAVMVVFAAAVVDLDGGRELAASAGAQTDAQIAQFIRSHGDTLYHPVGSCAMGDGPRSVCDADGRVHGVPGVVVADASLMPKITRANTNLPVVMIGERIARTL